MGTLQLGSRGSVRVRVRGWWSWCGAVTDRVRGGERGDAADGVHGLAGLAADAAGQRKPHVRHARGGSAVLAGRAGPEAGAGPVVHKQPQGSELLPKTDVRLG